MEITLKHLCQEYGLDPYALRQVLRKKMPHRNNQRWRWSEDDPDLKTARQLAMQMKDKSNGT